MAIKRVEIKDFFVFKGEFALDFCAGINVFIGGNGTGKTTLLRAMYAVQERSGNLSDFNHIAGYFRGSFSQDDVNSIFASLKKILLIHSNGSMFGYLSQSEKKQLLINTDDNGTGFIHKGSISAFNSVFIPEKDLLSNSKKLPESVEYGELQFTRCEIDFIKKARVAAQKPLQPLVKDIYNIIGGTVSNDGEEFYVQRDGIEKRIPFSMEASGYRKFGLLATLIRNEQIKSGTALFWDEPENSLNPELVPVLVNILLELSRNGVQIFMATHSEILARYFAINQQKGDSVMFTTLYKDGEQIKKDTSNRFDLLEPNNLTTEPVKLYEKEIVKGLNGDG
jgi:predicted ATPase